MTKTTAARAGRYYLESLRDLITRWPIDFSGLLGEDGHEFSAPSLLPIIVAAMNGELEERRIECALPDDPNDGMPAHVLRNAASLLQKEAEFLADKLESGGKIGLEDSERLEGLLRAYWMAADRLKVRARRSEAGRDSGEARRANVEERDIGIRRAAAELAALGYEEREIPGRLSRKFRLTARRIRDILAR